MSDEEIEQLAEELENKQDNGEKLTDEEWALLIAIEDERAARLDHLEEELRKSIEGQMQQKTQELFDQLNNL